MKFRIKHEIRGRIHISIDVKKLNIAQADNLEAKILQMPKVKKVGIYFRTGDVAICYEGDKYELLRELQKIALPDRNCTVQEGSGRATTEYYKGKLITKAALHFACKLFLPYKIAYIRAVIKALPFIFRGIKSIFSGRLEVSVLDAAAIGISLFRKDLSTAGSVMYLLGVGELLEEWTHKKSVEDLAYQMSIHVDKVWIRTEEGAEVQIPMSKVEEGDRIVVRTGGVVPVDGIVIEGEAYVNQASMTGESAPVHKDAEKKVFAGTVVEEGEILISAENVQGESRYERIIEMIEGSEKMKSMTQAKSEHLADKLVSISFIGFLATYLLTRNANKALSFIMVDYSCALKLSMPLAVLAAMKEAGERDIVIKGGKFMEACAEADVVIFDKTGTLTESEPKVVDVVSFNGENSREMLRTAACLEEHFPHSVANAVVRKAKEERLEHEEMHSKVEYVIAHGIVSTLDGKRVMIGSRHFIFEDEGVIVPEGEEDKVYGIPAHYSHLYLAIDGVLSAVICIEDPIREGADILVDRLKSMGLYTVMMTGDSRRTAESVAKKIGVDEYYAEVLPEDKAGYIMEQKSQGKKVIMIGDGINDSPALSACDAGIAMQDGSSIAREVADITISSNDLMSLATLIELSRRLDKRINRNYKFVIGFNSALIGAGILSLISPGTSALMHNISTLWLSIDSMNKLLD